MIAIKDIKYSGFRKLLSSAPVGVYQSNLRVEIFYVNPAVVEIFEFESPAQLIAEGALARYKKPEDREAFIQEIKNTGRVDSFEVEMLTRSGKTKNVLLSGALEGELISGFMVDITRLKKAEEKLKPYV